MRRASQWKFVNLHTVAKFRASHSALLALWCHYWLHKWVLLKRGTIPKSRTKNTWTKRISLSTVSLCSFRKLCLWPRPAGLASPRGLNLSSANRNKSATLEELHWLPLHCTALTFMSPFELTACRNLWYFTPHEYLYSSQPLNRPGRLDLAVAKLTLPLSVLD